MIRAHQPAGCCVSDDLEALAGHPPGGEDREGLLPWFALDPEELAWRAAGADDPRLAEMVVVVQPRTQLRA